MFNSSNACRYSVLVGFSIFLAAGMCGCAVQRGTIAERRGTLFPTTDAALESFKDAFRSEDVSRLVDIYGEEGRDIIITGDAVADKIAMRRISKFLDERAELVAVAVPNAKGQQWYKLRFGREGWDMRIPLANSGDGWYFATHHAAESAQRTRIAINEVTAMHTLVALTAAQRQYFHMDTDNDGIQEFAQRIISTSGSKDGLFWPDSAGDEPSPLDQRISAAISEGYSIEGSNAKSYEGYYYRVLTAQGQHAKGGKHSYLDGDTMTHGFAILAYPKEWNRSGTNSYVIDNSGIMYKKDLGFRTANIAAEMQEHDPENTWLRVDKTRYGQDVKVAPWLRPATSP